MPCARTAASTSSTSELFLAQRLVQEPPIPDEQARLPLDRLAQAARASHQGIERVVEPQEGQYGDGSRPDGGVVADHGVLDASEMSRTTISSRIDIWPTSRLPEDEHDDQEQVDQRDSEARPRAGPSRSRGWSSRGLRPSARIPHPRICCRADATRIARPRRRPGRGTALSSRRRRAPQIGGPAVRRGCRRRIGEERDPDGQLRPPSERSRRHRTPAVAGRAQPSAEAVARDDPDRDRVEDEHASSALPGSCRVLRARSRWSSRWPTANRSRRP